MPLSGTELPQELIEKIIDDLGDDPPSLLACCLVNHSFLPASQRHLRSTLHLRGESMSTTLGLFEQSQDDLAPLITTLQLSDFASRKVQLALHGIDSDSSGDAAAATAFSAFIPRLSNVTRLVIDATLDAYPNGMRFTHIRFSCIRALETFMPSRALYSLTFRNIHLHWRVLVIIAQCSSLKELRMEDVAISRDPRGGHVQLLYPTEALAAIRNPKPVLETLVLHNPDVIGRPMMYHYYWGEGMFSQFIRGLFVSETGGSNWADASKLQRLEYYEGMWPVLVEDYWDVQKLLHNVPDLKEFVWRWRDSRPFDLSHLPNVTVRQCERPKC